MDLFDRLTSADPPIVRPSGDLIKCMDDQREGFTVSPPARPLGGLYLYQADELAFTGGGTARQLHG